MKRLHSPRFRRHLAWSVTAVIAAATLTIVGLTLSNTGHSTATPLRPGPAWIYQQPPAATLSRSERLQLLQLAVRFIKGGAQLLP